MVERIRYRIRDLHLNLGRQMSGLQNGQERDSVSVCVRTRLGWEPEQQRRTVEALLMGSPKRPKTYRLRPRGSLASAFPSKGFHSRTASCGRVTAAQERAGATVGKHPTALRVAKEAPKVRTASGSTRRMTQNRACEGKPSLRMARFCSGIRRVAR